MRAQLVFAALVSVWGAGEGAARNGSRYGFYRSMVVERNGTRGPAGKPGAGLGSSRRVFGGEATTLSAYPSACVLLDRYWSARCSAAVVALRWALTAAHCVSPQIAYVKYNSRRPASPEGDLASVHYLYRHPGYVVHRRPARTRAPHSTLTASCVSAATRWCRRMRAAEST